MLFAILAFHIEINPLSEKRTPNNRSCKVKVFLSSQRKKNSNQSKKGSNAYQTDEIRD